MNQPQNTATPVGRYRWVVVALLFFATTINYIDRQVIGLLKPVLSDQFHWTETDYSHITMVFSASYALGLLVFGRVIDKIGTKTGYTISLIVWSIAAMLHAIAKSTLGFGVMRSLLGLGESGNFPAAIRAVTEWFPKKERALATGIFNSGANIGAVVSPVVVPWILGVYGWEMAFLLTGAIGFVWLIFWLIFYEIPERQSRVTPAEVQYIHSDNEAATDTGEAMGWPVLFRIRRTWAFVVGKFMTDPVWWFFLFWLPSYFSTTFKLDLKKPSWPLVVIYTATTIGSIGGGYLSSFLIRRGWVVSKARSTSMLFFALGVVPIIAARFATDIWQAVALISLAAAAHQAWSATIYTTVSDTFPKRAVSSVIGIGGMAGSIGGILFQWLIGPLLDYYKNLGNLTLGYNVLFIFCGFAYLIAWVVMQFLNRPVKSPSLLTNQPERVL